MIPLELQRATRVRAPRVVLSPLTRALLGRRVRVSSLPVSVQLAAMVARLRAAFGGLR